MLRIFLRQFCIGRKRLANRLRFEFFTKRIKILDDFEAKADSVYPTFLCLRSIDTFACKVYKSWMLALTYLSRGELGALKVLQALF